ncbi:MAG: CoA transferase [Desulfobacterales bacterium]|nr:CoA transferase [Desulfobacterales bacterium]
MQNTNKSLNDFLVLDLSKLLPGSYCSTVLANYGARVITIEKRDSDRASLSNLRNITGNKERLHINLKNEKGKKLFLALAQKADVIIENFRPGVTQRLGIEYQRIKKINPRIIYCSITGYGQTGALKDQAGHDINFLGYSGALSIMGSKDGLPFIPGIQIAAIVGALNAAVAIISSLFAREKTHTSRYIDISLTDELTAIMPIVTGWSGAFGAKNRAEKSKTSHRSLNYACYNIYQTADGKYITLGALEPQFWEIICNYFKVPQYIPLQFDSTKAKEMIDFFKNTFLTQTRDKWVEIFREKNVCLGKVLDVNETIPLPTPKPYEKNIHSHEVRKKIEENTWTILKELGLSDNEIQYLANEEVI